MERAELISALRRMKAETGSLVCLGCGYENSCSVKGCALIRAAADRITQDGIMTAALRTSIKDALTAVFAKTDSEEVENAIFDINRRIDAIFADWRGGGSDG